VSLVDEFDGDLLLIVIHWNTFALSVRRSAATTTPHPLHESVYSIVPPHPSRRVTLYVARRWVLVSSAHLTIVNAFLSVVSMRWLNSRDM